MRLATIATLLAACALAAAGCGGSTGSDEDSASSRAAADRPAVQLVTPADVRDDLDAGTVLLVDVRTTQEWTAGHAPDAMHVPLDDVADRLDEIERAADDRTIAFICRSGNRSAQAAELAVADGLEPVQNVDGGMGAWVDAGLPLDPPGGRVA